MQSPVTERFQLGGWAVAPRLNSISQNGKTIRLEPKVMQVLTCLAGARGDVVSKEELIRRVWADAFVTDDVLKRCIGELRKVFDDDPKHPSIIETIPKVGYRLVAPLEFPDQAFGIAPLNGARPGQRWQFVLAAGCVLLVVVAFAAVSILKRSPPNSLRMLSLSTLAGFENNPSVSPDGGQVAFEHSDESGTQWDVYVQAVGDEKAVKLTYGPGWSRCPAWSPDGHSLAYAREWLDEARNPASALAMMSPLGGSQQDLLRITRRSECRIAWSPDGRHLAFANKPANAAGGIFLLSLADRRVERLTTAPADDEDEQPSFSADGSWVAFVRRMSWGTRDIHIVGRSGKGIRRVTSLNANLGTPVWEPDGRHLLFWASPNGSAWGSDLYRVAVAGGPPERLPFGSGDSSYPAISRTGDRLAYAKTILDVNLWKLSLTDGEAPVKLGSSSRVDLTPALSPSGEKLAFVSDRDGSLAVWVSDADGSNAVKIIGIQQGGSLSWSPDGEQISYDARGEGHSHVYVVNPSTKQARQLTRGEHEDAVPTWSADGKHIYFTSTRSGKWNIWKVVAEGGEPVPVTRNGAVHPQESADGRYLYYAKPADLSPANSTTELAGIWRISTSGGPEQLVLPAEQAPDGWAWTVGSAGIYFVVAGEQRGAVLKFFNFDSRAVSQIAELPRYPWGGPGLAISPDGNSVIYGQVDVAESDIMVVDGYR
jgi:Tol biopolymer transport system component/DNA-binding winged helix-turn-helix (wHTH) protein